MSDDKPTRPESGRMRFGDDWTGVFLRGDWAGPHAMYLSRVIEDIKAGRQPDVRSLIYAGYIVEMLAGSDERAGGEVQQMRPFAECVAPEYVAPEPRKRQKKVR